MWRPGADRWVGCIGTAGVVVLLVSLAAACSSTPPRVTLYGDSLSVEARDELATQLHGAARLTAVVQGGAALCDAMPQIRNDLDHRKPNVVLIQFSGNNITDCMRGADGTPLEGDDLVSKYATDAALAVSMLRDRDVTVYLVGSPIDAHSDGAAKINAEFQKIAKLWDAEGGGVSYIDAGAAVLTPAGAFTWTLPCLDTETVAEGCKNGQIMVRAPDGTHFCPTLSGGTATCPVYSSGANRFAAAMADPVRDHLDRGVFSGF